MKTNQKLLTIFFFEGNGLVVYCAKQPQGVNFPFPTGSVEHMEILNFDAIRDLIAQACATLELADGPGLIVFGKTLLFEKQLALLAADKVDAAIEQFKSSTPFERVACHTYKNAQGSLLISMNRDFYDTLRQILERANVHIIGIVPQFILQSFIGTGPIQQKSLVTLSSKTDELSAESVIIHKAAPKTLQEKQEYISKKYSGLVVVIFILFLLAVFALTGYVLQSQFKASRPKATPVVVFAPIVTPLPTSTEEPKSTPESVASSSALLIVISHVPETASQAAILSKGLKASGFTQTTVKSQAGLQGNQPLIVFKTSLSSQYRDAILSVVRETFPAVSVQELSELGTDASITIGK